VLTSQLLEGLSHVCIRHMPLLTHNAQHATLQAVTEKAVVHVGSQGTPGLLVGSSGKEGNVTKE
jgi:hypothetical protein